MVFALPLPRSVVIGRRKQLEDIRVPRVAGAVGPNDAPGEAAVGVCLDAVAPVVLARAGLTAEDGLLLLAEALLAEAHVAGAGRWCGCPRAFERHAIHAVSQASFVVVGVVGVEGVMVVGVEIRIGAVIVLWIRWWYAAVRTSNGHGVGTARGGGGSDSLPKQWWCRRRPISRSSSRTEVRF